MLSASNSGVQGMPGVTLMVPAANASAALGSRITSDKNNVKLVDGTQLVLRVVNQ